MEIRQIQIEDAERLLHFFERLVVEDPERAETVEDVKKLTVEDEKSWIQSLHKKENANEMINLGCFSGNECIALGSIERMPRDLEKHVGDFRLGYLPNYTSEARELALKLMEKAQGLSIEVLLYFHFEIQQGVDLLKNLGFEENGVIPNYYKKNHKYINRIYLTKILKN
jgi:hypothetical protein